MGETSAISQMAEKVSDDIFSVFKWDKKGPVNINWECVNQEEHGRSSHPSDVVFSYVEPYENVRTYINCDLKSYAKKSIGKYSVSNAIMNLSESVTCANLSSEWQDNYMASGDNTQIHGMLFVYNHDGEYDSDFDSYLKKTKWKDLDLCEGSRVYVVSPYDVCYLATVATDIKLFLASKKIFNDSDYAYYYPNLERKPFLMKSSCAPATLEMLLGPIIVVKYKYFDGNNEKNGLTIYYKKTGESRDEFLYLFDYLFHYQLLNDFTDIEFKLPNSANIAAASFNHAKEAYVESLGEDATSAIKDRLENIKYSSVSTFVNRYSEIEIGMEYDK
ncbi:MAG: hypothetical protein QM484_10635 [Woeseiaceae bacterium]